MGVFNNSRVGAVAVLAMGLCMMMGMPCATVVALTTFSGGWKSTEPQMLSQGYFTFGFLNASGTFSLAVYIKFQSDSDRPVVWSAHNDSIIREAVQAPTLQPNAFLEAVEEMNPRSAAAGAFTLRLDDGAGHTVWQVEGVGAMDLKDDGNLLLYNHPTINQTIVWQSFDHPTNTLLKGQSLLPGMQLTSTSGDYSSVLYPGGLIALVNHISMVPGAPSSSLPYWFVSLNGSFDNGNYSDFGRTDIQEALLPARKCSRSSAADNGPINATLVLPINQPMPGVELQYSTCGSVKLMFYVIGSTTITLDFITLQDNGYLEAFNVLNGSGMNDLSAHTQPGGLISFPYSPISNYDQEPLFPCDVPNVCTSYGICVPGPAQPIECKCPSAASLDTALFLLVNDGCEPTSRLPISCVDHPPAKSVTFVEIQNTTFISMLISGWNYSTLPLTACLDLCRNNCSCVAVFFQHNTSLCLPVSRMMGLLDIKDSNFSAYLKIPVSAGHRSRLIFLTALLLLLPVLVAFVTLWWFYRRRRRSESDSDESPGSEDVLDGADFEQVLNFLPAKFSYGELKKATDGFNKRLGSGAFGSVYEGMLADGRRVAVKKLKSEINKGTKQFLAEVATIGRVDHVHVVRLFGFCSERSHWLLVYECMPNGSLDKWLFSERPTCDAEADGQGLHFLDWKMRLNIAVGASMGLSYLHNECTEPILHLDIKPQNILLDAHFMPKLSDFGMSRLIDREASSVVTQARGTPGYMAPELFFIHSTVTRKCDVYSLGMVLLELACGRRIYNPRCAEGAEYLPEWVVAKHREGKVIDVVDKRLMEGEAAPKYDPQEAKRVILTALWCIQPEPTLRPSAGALVRMLMGGDPVEDPPSISIKLPQRQISSENSSQVSSATSLWSQLHGR